MLSVQCPSLTTLHRNETPWSDILLEDRFNSIRLCSLLIKKTIAAQSTGVISEQDKSILLLKVLFFCRSDAAFSTIVASLYSCKHFIIRTASCLDLLLNVTESQRVMYVKESQRRLTKLLTASFVCPRRRPATN